MYGSDGRGFAAAVITGGLIGVSGTADGSASAAQSRRPAGPGRPPQRDQFRDAPGPAADRLGAGPEFGDAGQPLRPDFDQMREPIRDPRGVGQPASGSMIREPLSRESMSREPLSREPLNREPLNRDAIGRGEAARPPFGSGRRQAGSDWDGAPDGPDGFGAEATYRLTAAELDRAHSGRVESRVGEGAYRRDADRGGNRSEPAFGSGSTGAGFGATPVDAGGGRPSASLEATYRMTQTSEPGTALDATYRMPPGRPTSDESAALDGVGSADATYRLAAVGDRAPERAHAERPEEGRRRAGGSRHADAGSSGFRTVAELISATGGERVVSRRAQSRERAEEAERSELAERSAEPARDERRLDSPSQRALRVVSSGPIETESSRGALAQAEGARGTGFGAYGESPGGAARDEQKPARSQMFRNRAIESSLPNAAVVSQQFSAESRPRRDDAPPALRAVRTDGSVLGDSSARDTGPWRDSSPVRDSAPMRAVASAAGGFGAPAADVGFGGATELDRGYGRTPIDRGRDETLAEPRRPRHDALDGIEAAVPSRGSDRPWDGRYGSADSEAIDQRRGREDRGGIEDSSALGSLDSSALFGTLSGMRAVPERSPR